MASPKKAKYTTVDLIYVLMVGTPPTFCFAGWAWATELICPENIITNAYGQCYALRQPELNNRLLLWEDGW